MDMFPLDFPIPIGQGNRRGLSLLPTISNLTSHEPRQEQYTPIVGVLAIEKGSIPMKAIVTIEEITALSKVKASGLAMSIYMILAAHDWGKGSSFPSIATISKRLANQYSKSSIHRCLKWLEDQGFIKRNEAKSKNRFVLLMRKVKAALKAEVSKIRQPSTKNRTIREKKKKRNNYCYSKNASQRKKINGHQKRRQIADWIDEMVSIQSLKDMLLDDQYGHLLEGLSLDDASYQYPPKPQGKWDLSEVKQAFRQYGHGVAEAHWVFDYYMARYI